MCAFVWMGGMGDGGGVQGISCWLHACLDTIIVSCILSSSLPTLHHLSINNTYKQQEPDETSAMVTPLQWLHRRNGETSATSIVRPTASLKTLCFCIFQFTYVKWLRFDIIWITENENLILCTPHTNYQINFTRFVLKITLYRVNGTGKCMFASFRLSKSLRSNLYACYVKSTFVRAN